MSLDEYRELKRGAKGGLQGVHMGWDMASGLCETEKDIVEYIEDHEDLEVVYVGNPQDLTDQGLLDRMTKLAFGLANHPYVPWVCLDEDCKHLEPIFQSMGIYVSYESVSGAVLKRWDRQVIKQIA